MSVRFASRWITILSCTAIVLPFITSTLAEDYDDPIVSFSSWDNIQEMVRAGLKLDHAELVIQRATMGASGVDKTYQVRKHQFDELRLMWGAYHFPHDETESSESVDKQVKHFLTTVSDDHLPSSGRVLLAIDWLPYGKRKDKFMSAKAVADFVSKIESSTGLYPGITTQLDFLEKLSSEGKIDADSAQVLGKCWLWVQSWKDEEPVLPKGSPWSTWQFWLYDSVDNPTHQARVGSKVTPDLSRSRISRGKDLEQWWNEHSWNGVMRH